MVMHTYFLGLTAVGYDALWGSLVRNGTAQAIGAVKAAGTLPDGSPLRLVYTAWPAIDRLLISPVIFYDALMRDHNPTFRSLLVSLFCTMQTTSFCMVAAGWAWGFPRWATILGPLFWGIVNQSYGAAFIYPLYLFAHTHPATTGAKASTNVAAMSPVDAEALAYTSILAGLLPAWLLWPAFVSCSTETRQFLIASYRLTPILLGLAQPAFAALIQVLRRKPLDKSATRPLVQASLYMSGLFSVIGHWYAISSAVLSPSVSLAGIFLPGVTQTAGAPFRAIIGLGCHKFLQNDFWVILAGFIPFASAMLCRDGNCADSTETPSNFATVQKFMLGTSGSFLSLGALSTLISPGAVLAWSMAASV
ncbi:zn 2cys6 transcription factor [Cordyceps javanica]|uniref:Zn 2cys6 transcription factor n=1 Tax=Cordyceps javanica TaxID=43265 RepID=A0A545V7U4_9HYPO|nr:zn 2cys6 transcription factor [Cordyceps javanica]TQW09032.1 zn 2cys6 transcription factor [Cordyceps javanica]